MTDWKNHTEFQQALKKYLFINNLKLENESYESGIDCVGVFIKDVLVLSVGLPPVSNYNIHKTKYTEKYLRINDLVAV